MKISTINLVNLNSKPATTDRTINSTPINAQDNDTKKSN